MKLLFHMSSHVRDVITLFLFILVILFLWPLTSISSLTWLWGAFVNDYALFFHIGPITLEHLGLWLEISTPVNLSKADSTFGIRLSRMAMQERLLFSCFFPYVFDIAQPDFTRKDVTVNGVIRTVQNWPSCGWGTWFSLVFSCLRTSWWTFHPVASPLQVAQSCGWLVATCWGRRVNIKRVNMERERERTYGDDAQHSLADDPRAVCVTHKSLNHKKHTKFWIVLVILLFYCPFFLKRNVLFANFFFSKQLETLFFFHSFG